MCPSSIMSLNTLLPWFSFLGLLILPLFLLRKTVGKASAWKLPPGPSPLPIIGNLHQLGTMSFRELWKLSKKYGPLMHLQLGSVPTLVVSSARMAELVMRTHDLDFCSRPPLTQFRRLSYNFLDVSFAPYGEYWREMRKICTLELYSHKRVHSFRNLIEEEVGKTIESISRTSESVNLSETLPALANRIICKVAFGKNHLSESETTHFQKVTERAQAICVGFWFANVIPWLGWMDIFTGMDATVKKVFKELDVIYEQMIEEHLDPKRPRPEQEDLLDVLLRIQKEHHLSISHVKGILMNILIAGTDTGPTTVIWATTELMRNSEMMEKAQSEVREVVGRKGKVEESDLHQLKYLNSVVKETLRLHTPAPLLLPRETLRHCRVDGYDIPPKTMVFVNAFAIGQDPEYWENPDEFLPERFTHKSVDYKGQHFELIPFGAGRRICPGLALAVVTVELMLASLLYSYDWKLPEGMSKENIDMSEHLGIAVSKKSPLLLVPTRYVVSIGG